MLRKGLADNVMVFPLGADYDSASFGYSGGQYTFTHKALGAERFRFSTSFGQTWYNWSDWEATSTIDPKLFPKDALWPGQHLMVQCERRLGDLLCVDSGSDNPYADWSSFATSSTYVVHADRGFSQKRRVPQFLARGAFNQWGFDKGTQATLQLNDQNYWELEVR